MTPALRGLIQSGKRFTSALPQVEGYRSDYYQSTAQGADAAVTLQVLHEDHQLQELVPRHYSCQGCKAGRGPGQGVSGDLIVRRAQARTLPREAMTEAQETLFL
jgi:hypothetical protein